MNARRNRACHFPISCQDLRRAKLELRERGRIIQIHQFLGVWKLEVDQRIHQVVGTFQMKGADSLSAKTLQKFSDRRNSLAAAIQHAIQIRNVVTSLPLASPGYVERGAEARPGAFLIPGEDAVEVDSAQA